MDPIQRIGVTGCAGLVLFLGGMTAIQDGSTGTDMALALCALIGATLLSGAGLIVPWGVACRRGHSSALAIFALCVLLGWTGIGWIAALVWSLAGAPRLAGVK
jgi:hypothetical protein